MVTLGERVVHYLILERITVYAEAMIVTLTGAFKNAGDYLIGDRARKLVRAHVDAEVIDINRKEITDSHYETFNKARAVLLTGGPAYQKMMYPKIYDLDVARIEVPIIPFGLGWKGHLGQTPQEFEFSTPATQFIQHIHSDKSHYSSARDFLTLEVLKKHGVENVAMTGCPAWYDEAMIDQDYEFSNEVKTLVFSMPAAPNNQVKDVIAGLAKRFPMAKKYLTFQAGYRSTNAHREAEITKWFRSSMFTGFRYGFRPVSFESDFGKFTEVMSQSDFHIGYRVHSHIFSLSQRKSSILIAEDSRGIGQTQAMGGEALKSSDSSASILSKVDDLFDSKGQAVEQSISTMRKTYPTMLDFLGQI